MPKEKKLKCFSWTEYQQRYKKLIYTEEKELKQFNKGCHIYVIESSIKAAAELSGVSAGHINVYAHKLDLEWFIEKSGITPTEPGIYVAPQNNREPGDFVKYDPKEDKDGR